MPPSTVIKEIEMQFANFFWGQRDGKNSYHWASWKNMCFPTKEGGLGFKSLIDICHTFSAKRWWRLRTEPSLWSLFLKAKYCQRSNPNSKVIATKDSMAWKDLLCTRDKMEQHIIWKINSGNSMFWWDNWTQVNSLFHIINPNHKPDNVKVNTYITNHQWDLDHIQYPIPIETLNLIKGTPIGNRDTNDKAIWKLSNNGYFSCSTAFENLRKKNVASPIYNYIWIKEIPFKASFLMWRILRNKLPIDSSMSRFNINANSSPSCSCCRIAQHETNDHLFAVSDMARQTWSQISRPLGFNITGNTVNSIVWHWWRQHPKNNLHKYIFLITPIIACWEIWKARCIQRYEKKKVTASNICFPILFQVKAAIKKKFKFIDYTWNWSKVCLMEENFKAIITSSMIYWNRPNGNNWKLNTDGSYMRNQNKAGAGGIVRNSIGDMIIAFSYPTQCYTNNYSEAQAALIGISWCLGQQFEALEVELDSQVVVRMINGSCKPPWRIHNLIEDIKNKIAQRNIIVKHCYREGNEVADALAKYATNIQEPIIYFQESKLPAEVRGLLRMNKLHLPSFRRRPKKASFWHYNPP
ncbi:hypothetical protein AABB24_003503 [Solanum stoloniferum]